VDDNEIEGKSDISEQRCHFSLNSKHSENPREVSSSIPFDKKRNLLWFL
jgi:hypothetical protein